MENFIYVLFCAVLMRIKGGGVIKVEHSKFTSSCGFAVLVFGITGDAVTAACSAVAWFIGCAPAIRQVLLNLGGYRGSIGAFEGWGEYKVVTAPIDFIVDNTSVKLWTHDAVRKFYGWTGTMIRGLAMGIPLAIVFQSWWLLVVGPAMAPCYFAGMSVVQYVRKIGVKRAVYSRYFDGWSLGEWFWGGFISIAMLTIL